MEAPSPELFSTYFIMAWAHQATDMLSSGMSPGRSEDQRAKRPQVALQPLSFFSY